MEHERKPFQSIMGFNISQSSFGGSCPNTACDISCISIWMLLKCWSRYSLTWLHMVSPTPARTATFTQEAGWMFEADLIKNTIITATVAAKRPHLHISTWRDEVWWLTWPPQVSEWAQFMCQSTVDWCGLLWAWEKHLLKYLTLLAQTHWLALFITD